MYRTIYKEVEIDVELVDFDTEDLIEELESRGKIVDEYGNCEELITAIWLKRRMGQDYQKELDELIYVGLGKVV